MIDSIALDLSAAIRESADDTHHFYGAWEGGRESAGGHPAGMGSHNFGPPTVTPEQAKASMDRQAAAALKYPDVMGLDDLPSIGADAYHVTTRINQDIHAGHPDPHELEGWDSVFAAANTSSAPFTVYRAGRIPSGLQIGSTFSDPGYTWAAERATAKMYTGSRASDLLRIAVMPGVHFLGGESWGGGDFASVVLARDQQWTVLGRHRVTLDGEPATFWDVSVSPSEPK